MGFDRRNLAQRIVIAVIAIPLVLWAVLSGGVAIAVFAAVLTVLGSWEWVGIGGLQRFRWLVGLQLTVPMLILAAFWFDLPHTIIPGSALIVMASLAFGILGPWRESGGIKHVGATLLGIAYVSLFGLLIPISRIETASGAPLGAPLIATALVMVWLTDTFAYFGGSALGKHRLAPSVSPKKSWEGAAFGFLGSIAGALLGAWMFGVHGIHYVELAAFGAAMGVVSQIGDLAESMVKRDAGVKDSSGILPGHGGVLDRFDSFLFILPPLWIWLMVRSAL